MAIRKDRFVVTIVLAVVLTVTTWLILGDNSPFQNYFLQHVTMPNLFRVLLTVPCLLVVILRPSSFVDALSYIFILLQWLIAAYIVASVSAENLQSEAGLAKIFEWCALVRSERVAP
jgi:hypothetical protein